MLELSLKEQKQINGGKMLYIVTARLNGRYIQEEFDNEQDAIDCKKYWRKAHPDVKVSIATIVV